jgi:hypothetical protein
MSLLRRNKKAQAEAQFNWIFVLIVGGVILLFFTAIVLKQKSVSEQKLSANIVSDLESIFTGAYVSKDTSHLLDVPKLDVDFDCSRFYLGQVNKPLGKQIVFAPSKIKGTQVLTWTLEWNFPFKVVNFLLITSPEMRYVFVYDDSDSLAVDLASSINDSLPDGLNFEFYKYSSDFFSSITDKNNYKVRFVFIGDFKNVLGTGDFFPLKLSSMGGQDLTALLVVPSQQPVKEIYFYRSTGSAFELVGDVSYALDFVQQGEQREDLPSLFGAIFTDDHEFYDCAMRKAFERLGFVADVYKDKTSQLVNFYEGVKRIVCKSATSNVLNDIFNNLVDGAVVCKDGFPADCDVSTMGRLVADLDNSNRGLLFHSCALIY